MYAKAIKIRKNCPGFVGCTHTNRSFEKPIRQKGSITELQNNDVVFQTILSRLLLSPFSNCVSLNLNKWMSQPNVVHNPIQTRERSKQPQHGTFAWQLRGTRFFPTNLRPLSCFKDLHHHPPACFERDGGYEFAGKTLGRRFFPANSRPLYCFKQLRRVQLTRRPFPPSDEIILVLPPGRSCVPTVGKTLGPHFLPSILWPLSYFREWGSALRKSSFLCLKQAT